MTADGGSNEAVATPDMDLLKKYTEESEKRFREDGSAQYLELAGSEVSKLAELTKDPWVDHDVLNAQPPNLKDSDDIKVLILGAGFGGLLHAVYQVEAGINPSDIRMVDVAGGFGGTWYWNRYPGIMVDVESSIYLPLLEDTGYMPKNRFSYGPEIREYIVSIAEKWNLTDKGVFRTQARSYDWMEDEKRWKVVLTQDRGPKEQPLEMAVTAQFVVITGGVLNHPKTPKIPGLESFAGEMIHTGRWNYDISGGSPVDWTLSKLKGKKVGIVGTGATAVQCVPQLAQWADQLYVFQRTPSSVDERDQASMIPEHWEKVTSKKGWWRARNENWCGMLAGHPMEENMVKDRWSESKSYRYLAGGLHDKPYTMEDIPELIGKAVASDAPRAERVRQRVDTIVKDKETADALKAWYPIWCKRPCFHDDYLPTFNLPHVSLVDTNAKGIESVNANGIVAGGKKYDLDVIIWSTGYRSPVTNMAEPSHNANISMSARGNTLAGLWAQHGATTLHGTVTPWMPNVILSGPSQTAACGNFMYTIENIARHGAYIISETIKRADDPKKATVEAVPEAAEAWALQILTRATFQAPLAICGPSYFNEEGATRTMSTEERMKMMRGAICPLGVLKYVDTLQDWRADGKMEGLKLA
ncbi:flavin-binding monooxygenase-like family protein [Pochonia chlamydosporia 170]|uniref:Flavin-binding monooxygenase-like family protein n=1 Tax=Pochonia chlamydosporia 170 TaxID=1380566 RepID=A0A179FTZ9_METCM|nr:flavin-binding monooxygenase-like family protein [Pochonia chlamydosporia 170]OAQ68718.1 flavin-binding monooxygenase-like family protein [Pochonia chlamydosporia 170]